MLTAIRTDEQSRPSSGKPSAPSSPQIIPLSEDETALGSDGRLDNVRSWWIRLFCGRPRKPRPLRQAWWCFLIHTRFCDGSLIISSSLVHCELYCHVGISTGMASLIFFSCIAHRDDTLDDESYSSYRCRQHLLNTIHASLTYFPVENSHRSLMTTDANDYWQCSFGSKHSRPCQT